MVDQKQSRLAHNDPMHGWFDRMLETGDNIDLLRNFCLMTLSLVGKTVAEYKSHSVTLGYGSKETMDKIFPEE